MSHSKMFFGGTAAVIAVLYLAAAAFIPLVAIDALYLPDDTYYTLTIARNIAAGIGPSTDGVILTTGFQPLIALILQPVFWLGFDGDAALRAAIVVSAACAAGAILLAGLIVRQATQSTGAAVMTLVLVAVSMPVFGNALNGLETSLAGVLGLWLVYLACGTTAAHGAGRLACVGVLAGLALWARIDLAFVILVLLPVALWRLGLAKTALVALVAAVTVAPWVGYCLVQTGSPVPESGSAVRQIVAYYFEIGREHSQNVAEMYEDLGRVLFPALPVSVASFAPLFFAGPVLLAARKRAVDGPAVLAAAAVVTMVFYIQYLPAFWFYPRYMFLGSIALIVAFVVTLWPLVQRGRGVPAVVLTALIAAQHGELFFRDARVWAGVDDRFVAGHFYADAAKVLMPQVPAGSVVTAMQSGALSWYAPDGVRVVNLDGVVNRHAKEALADGTMDNYLRALGATHFADWQFNKVWLNDRSTAPVPMTEIARRADHQREGLHFTLYRLDQAARSD